MSSATRQIIGLIATGQAVTRAQLAAALGAAPSTVSLRVARLISAGLITEADHAPSTGGRPARVLRLRDEGGAVQVAEVGSRHARAAIVGLDGTILASAQTEVDVAEGPEATLDRIIDAWSTLTSDQPIRATGLALPAPVDPVRGAIVQASRMPGWDDIPVADLLRRRLGLPVVVENDAAAMALGEHRAHPDRTEDSLTVKAGTAIGAGFVVGGAIYHGASVGVGNITHTQVDSADSTVCSCGNSGCLETVASGAGIARLLRDRGIEAHSVEDVVRLTQRGNPDATGLVRTAGGYLGAVLCTVANFVNPGAIYLGGALSTVEPFVAAVRGRLYAGSHPIATGNLRIEATSTGADAGVLGMARLAVGAAHLAQATA